MNPHQSYMLCAPKFINNVLKNLSCFKEVEHPGDINCWTYVGDIGNIKVFASPNYSENEFYIEVNDILKIDFDKGDYYGKT